MPRLVAATPVIRIPNLRKSYILWRASLLALGRGAAPCISPITPHVQDRRLLRSRTRASSLATGLPQPQSRAVPRLVAATPVIRIPNLRKGDIPWRASLLALGREAAPCIPTVTPHVQDWRLLRSRARASSLATGSPQPQTWVYVSASCCHSVDQNPKFEEELHPVASELARVGSRSGPRHFPNHTASAGLTTAAQPSASKLARHRFASART
ncbi:hypothetical protein FBY12_0512 [Pseudomonas sp. SJZ131]|nr:hypothetical protein FBY12_0512 [Pseudomonas sp. SJZ131]